MLHRFSYSTILRHPLATLRFALGNKRPIHEAMLLRAGRLLMGESFLEARAREAIRELRKGDFTPMVEMAGFTPPGNRPTFFMGKALYFLVRCLQPEFMVETGVSHGVSSWTILNAMERNGTGRLVSIDLPDHDLAARYNLDGTGLSPGWVVPDALRSRWTLNLGRAQDLLPEILKNGPPVDVFFHDSDHSFAHMKWEFDLVYPAVRGGGLIISDDVHTNTSFQDFVTCRQLIGIQFFSKGGAAVHA